ncbi:hypothetical protein ASPCAL07130 [Aspergillus calidoustus]|uniref:Uncharacterized protein n=1 Tax=Aspergillus calidoustus TaxID=454130 RepID=A0A0U5G200_ASPCI|nr:hypothetical protein ASPCAL07130 [Aspergillus calidoustus]
MLPPVPSFTATWHNAPYALIFPLQPELSAAGKIVIVTGAASGIGRATASSFARAGATKIILIGRNKANLEKTQRSLPCASSLHAVDVRDEQAVSRVASAVGRWDVS